MPDVSDVLRLNDKVIDFARDIQILEAIEELVAIFGERRAELSDMGVADVLEFMRSLEEDQALFDALGQIGVDADALKERATAVSAAIGRLSPEQRKLLRPLSDFEEEQVGGDPGLVPWMLLDAGRTQDGAGARIYTFNLGARAALAFEAGDTWPGSGPQPESLLRVGIAGSLAASASARIPLQPGSLGASSENAASASIDLYFDTSGSDELYAAAAARRLGDLCNPFSLDSLWRAANRDGLYGVIGTVSGSTSLSIDVAIAEGFTLADEIGAGTTELTVGASVFRSGNYDLTVRRLAGAGGDAQMLEVTLRRDSLVKRERSLSLAVRVDLEALAARVRALLERHQGSFREILSEYEPFLTPGTYLNSALPSALESAVDDIVSDEDVKNVLKEAFRVAGGLGKRPRLPELKSLINREIIGRLDELGTVVTGHADRVAADVAARIADRIGLDVGEATAAIEEGVAGAVGEIQSSLEDDVRSLSAGALEQLAGKLERAGANVSGAAESADEALKGVREIIGKYEGLLEKLVTHTEDAARTKVTAKLTLEERRTRGKSVDVRMILSRNTPATAEAFATVLRGDMDGIIGLLQKSTPGVDFDRENMALTRFATVSKKLGIDIVFLGIELHTQSIFDADAHITSDGAGRVSVESRANYKRRRDTAKEDREIRFVDSFELAAARSTGQFTIELGISYEDQALERHEVIAFLESYENARLLPAGTSSRAVEVLEQWAGPGDDPAVKADINLGLALDAKSSMQVMQLSERDHGNLTDACRRRLFRIAIRELGESGAYDLGKVAELAESVRAQTNMDDGKLRTDVLFDYTRQLHERTVGDPNLSPSVPRHRRRIDELESASRLHGLCMGFVEFVDTMGDIFEATPGAGGDGTWNEDDYLDAQRKLNRLVRRWLKIKSKAIFWISDEAHPRTVAFTGALIALASTGDDEGGAPALTVSLVRRDGTEEIVMLAG